MCVAFPWQQAVGWRNSPTVGGSLPGGSSGFSHASLPSKLLLPSPLLMSSLSVRTSAARTFLVSTKPSVPSFSSLLFSPFCPPARSLSRLSFLPLLLFQIKFHSSPPTSLFSLLLFLTPSNNPLIPPPSFLASFLSSVLSFVLPSLHHFLPASSFSPSPALASGLLSSRLTPR